MTYIHTSRGVRSRVRGLVVVEARGLRHRAGRRHPFDARDLGHDGALVGLQFGRHVGDRVLVAITNANDGWTRGGG